MCRIPFILNLTFCPLALEKYVYVSNPPSNEKKGEDPLQMRKKEEKRRRRRSRRGIKSFCKDEETEPVYLYLMWFHDM